MIDHYGTVKDGIFEPDSLRDYNKALSALDDKRVQLNIKKVSKRRSNPLNAYYWGVVLAMIAKETGHSVEEIHSAMKYRHLEKKTYMFTYIQSTKDLDTAQFQKYLSDIRAWASEFLGMWIPNPNEKEMY